jgi:arginine repressor
MAMMIKEQMNVEVSQQTVSLMLRKLNITKKKGMVTYKEGNTELGIEQRY